MNETLNIILSILISFLFMLFIFLIFYVKFLYRFRFIGGFKINKYNKRIYDKYFKILQDSIEIPVIVIKNSDWIDKGREEKDVGCFFYKGCGIENKIYVRGIMRYDLSKNYLRRGIDVLYHEIGHLYQFVSGTFFAEYRLKEEGLTKGYKYNEIKCEEEAEEKGAKHFYNLIKDSEIAKYLFYLDFYDKKSITFKLNFIKFIKELFTTDMGRYILKCCVFY